MMSQDTPRYDAFTNRARSYGVEITECPPDDVAAAVDERIEGPAIGTPLPWPDVELPEQVTTAPTPADLENAATGVTAASLAIAEYGSLVLRMDELGSEPVSLFNDRHVVVLRKQDIVPDMAAAFEWLGDELRETRGSAILATGPSATADMGALVQGAHGPKEVEVIVVS
ncbi:lactate utilization protein C [Natronoarchaeum sp. GCM10025703]|uniref:LutC/YkgG family protein n=1 Tax=unclassified Natronoarchaeum TaxID=2620183 RepID=UPI00362267C1